MASIEKRGGSYRVKVYVRGRYISRSVHTHAEAKALAAELQHKVNQGKIAGPSNTSVAAFLEDYLLTFGDTWSPSTLVTVEPIIRKHLIPGIGDIVLTKLSTRQIDLLYAKLRKTLKPASVRRIHSVLHRALEVARKSWELIPVNPATDASPGPQPKRAVNPVTSADLILVLTHVTPETARFLRVMASTGARPAELCALQIRDVDLEAGRLAIRRRVVRGKELEVIDLTKSGKGRTISIGSVTAAVLREQIAFITSRLPLTDKHYVFSDEPSRPWNPNTVSRRFREAAKEVGVTARLYDLRHGAVTNLLAAGIDINTISARIGHARPSTTLNHYAGVIPGADEHAAAEADRLMT